MPTESRGFSVMQVSVVRGFSDTQQVPGANVSFDVAWVTFLLYFLSFAAVLVVICFCLGLLGTTPVL